MTVIIAIAYADCYRGKLAEPPPQPIVKFNSFEPTQYMPSKRFTAATSSLLTTAYIALAAALAGGLLAGLMVALLSCSGVLDRGVARLNRLCLRTRQLTTTPPVR